MNPIKVFIYICLTILVGSLIWLGRPLYWVIYAEFIDPFEDISSQQVQTTGGVEQQNGKLELWRTLQPSLPLLKLPLKGKANKEEQLEDEKQQGQSEDNKGQEEESSSSMGWEVSKEEGEVQQEDELECITLKFKGQKRFKQDIKPEEYPLTKACMALYADNAGYIIVTWANLHYLEFVMNWIWHWHQLDITHFVVGAMDDDILKHLASAQLPTFAMSTGMTTTDFGWGTPNFHKMGRQKIGLIKTFLEFGLQVIISDVDCMWFRDPRPFFDKYPSADILSSSDHLSNTVPDESLEKWPEAGSAANIGIMLLRPGAMQLVSEWVNIIEKDDKVWDQNAFNDLFRKGNKPQSEDPDHLFMAYDGAVKMGILPVSIFCSGHTYHVQKMPQTLGLEAYVVHNDFQFSGMEGKRHRFREALQWNDGLQYFDYEGGFITYDLHLPGEMKTSSGPANPPSLDLSNAVGHFQMVNHQLTQLRNAFAISSALNRFLVLPPLWCGLDRWWAPHKGTIPGSKFNLPFQCPLDHVLDLEVIIKGLNTNEYGPDSLIKEHSFFENTRIKDEVKNDQILVKVVDSGTQGCSDGSQPASLKEDGKSICIWSGMNDHQIRTAVQSVRNHKVLRFQNMQNAFSRHADSADWEKFKKRMARYGSLWCCIQAHPGHIHYDLLWDIIPHVDKHNKQWKEPWKLQTGP